VITMNKGRSAHSARFAPAQLLKRRTPQTSDPSDPEESPVTEHARDSVGEDERPQTRRDGIEAIAASSVRPVAVEWLWPQRIPLGTLTLLVGDPGLGKSLLTCQLAAQLSSGQLGREAVTLLVTAEDSLAVTVVPRLQAAGAQLERVKVVSVRREGFEEGVSLPDQVRELARLVETERARLVVVDPLMAHLRSEVNSWQDQSIRRALAPLHRLADEAGCAVLVVAHLNKGQDTDPLRRIGGSMGIPGAARSALLLARDPDDPEGEQGRRRVLAQVKNNLAAPAPSLLFQIEETLISSGEESVPAAVLRLLGESPHGGFDLLGARVETRSALEEAAEFLRLTLADGARPAAEVSEAALQARIAPRTLKRAKERLGVESTKPDYSAGWVWALPPEEAEA
jgi:KaiC/GvpD/RAD55 family RecA-like ATPase